jgi:hypothetical protein
MEPSADIFLKTPFWANNHSDMYVRVLQDELQFPDDRAIDQDTKSLIRGVGISPLLSFVIEFPPDTHCRSCFNAIRPLECASLG